MRDRLVGLLEQADLALGSARGLIDDAALVPLIDAVASVRARLAYPEDILVLALAGGTGSGKSSLFNALVGDDLVDVGGVRPTTSHPAAAIPASAGTSLDGYLDLLGIEERHQYEDGNTCVVDLPDTDSVEIENRHRVDAILPRVDLVIWVTDPEKYRDARLHNDYLKPLVDYSDQFLFVLNQTDRLTAAQTDEVSHDFATALESDGLGRMTVFPIAAAPISGPPIGLDSLRKAVESKRETRDSLYGRLLTDLAATAHALEAETGLALDFDDRAGPVLDRAADELTGGDVVSAGDTLTGFLDDLARAAGGITASHLERLAAEVPDHLRRINDELNAGVVPVRTGWWRLRRVESGSPDPARARELLSEAVIRPTRALLARRALAVASVAELGVAIASLRSGPRR